MDFTGLHDVFFAIHSESIYHLLKSYSFVSLLWDKATENTRRSKRVKGNITKTLQQWDENPFQSLILNLLWELLPGFITWNIWKERNLHIFVGNKNTMEEV